MKNVRVDESARVYQGTGEFEKGKAMRIFARKAALAALSAAVGGCASIVGGQNQPISVQARSGAHAVSGAECELTNDKGKWFVVAPGSTTVTRSYDDLHVTCSREGYEPGTTTARSTTKGMAFGNILVGGIIGAAVDMSSGAAYDYPSLITVRMTQIAAELAPEPMVSVPAAVPVVEIAPAAAGAPVGASPPPAPARTRAPTRRTTGLPAGTVILGPQ